MLRLLTALAFGLGVVLVPSLAAYAQPVPAPYPDGQNATATSWWCEVTPASGGGVTGTPDVKAREDCAVTAWATEPAYPSPPAVQRVDTDGPLPVVAAQALPVTATTAMPLPVREVAPTSENFTVVAASETKLDAEQYEGLLWGAGLVLFFAVVHVIRAWGSSSRG